MSKNVGGIDRILRIVVGVALIAAYFMNPNGAYSWLYWLGLIPLLTGLFSFCPLYTLLGMNTCPRK